VGRARSGRGVDPRAAIRTRLAGEIGTTFKHASERVALLYRTDQKWQGYLEFCDRFFWAVDADFPTELLPDETGLIIADAYDAEVVRVGPETRLAGARRKLMLQKFARHAALGLQGLRDPGLPPGVL
jgi:hypothetical protein